MADEKSVSEKLDAFFDSFNKRMDAADNERKADRARLDAYCAKADAADEEKKADKARKDAEDMAAEKARKDAAEKEEKEKEEKAKADAAKKDAEEKEEQAKKDSAARAGNNDDIRATLADLQKRLPAELPEADRQRFVAAQFKAEPVAQAFGDSAGAPRWLNGESEPDYRRRLMGKYKSHSPRWKEKDLSKVDASVLDIAEEQIYADAMQAALHPADLPAGTLRTIEKKDQAGRVSYHFVGNDEAAAWAPFCNVRQRGRFVRPSQH